jgi:hypothetical protein
VSNPKLAKHPIRRYFSNPNLLAEIIFDNPKLDPFTE